MQKEITYITGNQDKADYLAKYLELPVKHLKLDLDEIQSLDLREVVEHKVKQAYNKVRGPVFVEDTTLEFTAHGRLPGTFIKFFVSELGYEQLCRLLDGKDRSAIGRCMFAYYDGQKLEFAEGKLEGSIAENPSGKNGFGWDPVFIEKGKNVTRANLNEIEYEQSYTTLKPFAELKKILTKNN